MCVLEEDAYYPTFQEECMSYDERLGHGKARAEPEESSLERNPINDEIRRADFTTSE